METEASHQLLLGNDNSPNLTQEPLHTDGRTARNLMDRDTPRKNSDDQDEDKAVEEAESPGNGVNQENDDSPTFREKEDKIERSPDDVGEDDGKMLQEEGGNIADQEELKDEPIDSPDDIPTKKGDDGEETRGLVEVKPTPSKPKNAKVGKLRSMGSFWRQNSTMSAKKEMRDHYVNVSDLLPEGIESADALRKFYEDKRSVKKIKHLSSFPQAHEEAINCLIFTPDQKLIVSGSNDRTIKIWDVDTNPYSGDRAKRQLHHMKDAHEKLIAVLAMTSDGKHLISGAFDGSIKVWDFATRQLFHHFENAHLSDDNQACVSGIAITSDNKYFATCSLNQSMKIFDLNAKKEIAHLEEVHRNQIRAINITSDNKYLISASSDGTVKLFDFATRENVFSFENLHSDPIRTMALTPDNRYIVTGSLDKSMKIIDLEARKEIYCFTQEEGVEDSVDTIALSSGGQLIFAGISNGSLLMLDMKTKKLIRQFKDIHKGRFSGLAISKNMDFAISCSSDSSKSIEVIEIEEKQKMFTNLKKAHSGLENFLIVKK